jgi:hypothetical protein
MRWQFTCQPHWRRVNLNRGLALVQSGSGGRALVVNAPAAAALRDRVVAVFGSKAAEAMQPLQAGGPDGLQITGCDGHSPPSNPLRSRRCGVCT